MTPPAFLDAIECDLDAEPMFHIDPTDSEPESEIERQVQFRSQCRMLMPHVLLVAIPNAGKRGQKALNQARREGAIWGFPDMLAFVPGKVAGLEWKNGKKPPEQHQIDVLNRLHRMGFPVGVFRRADSAVAWLRKEGF